MCVVAVVVTSFPLLASKRLRRAETVCENGRHAAENVYLVSSRSAKHMML